MYTWTSHWGLGTTADLSEGINSLKTSRSWQVVRVMPEPGENTLSVGACGHNSV